MAEHIGNVTANVDELLRAYDEGKSTEELNEMLDSMEENGEVSTEEQSPENENLPFADEPEDNESDKYTSSTEKGTNENMLPFKSFDTQEHYQKHIDRIIDNRFRKNKEAEEKREAEFDSFKKQVADLLGVSPESVLDELEKRNLTAKAEQEGLSPEMVIKDARTNRELERLREEIKRRDHEAEVKRAIADITAQGEVLSKDFPGFNLDEAMEDDTFRSTVFSLYNISPESAVKKAFLASEGMGNNSQNISTPAKRTIAEGAAKSKSSAPVKKINVAELSDREVLELEKKILRGEKVNFE